jgi:hypothetical protein
MKKSYGCSRKSEKEIHVAIKYDILVFSGRFFSTLCFFLLPHSICSVEPQSTIRMAEPSQYTCLLVDSAHAQDDVQEHYAHID